MRRGSHLLAVLSGLTLIVGLAAPTSAQLVEDFNAVTETGGGTFLTGAGFFQTLGWDDGLIGEKAYADTEGSIQITASAQGDATAGVSNTGAGVVSVSASSFNILFEDFEGATAAGSTIVLDGDGSPDTFNIVTNWDAGLAGEEAYGGTYGGAALNGDVTAQALASGGVGSSKAGQIDIENVTNGGGGWFAGLQWNIGAFPGAAAGLDNAGFEDGLDSWLGWANIHATAAFTHTGAGALQMYGPFNGEWDASGIYQDLAEASEGDDIEFSIWGLTATGDQMQGDNFVVLKIEFYSAGDALLSAHESPPIMNASTPVDTWEKYTWNAIAPANTAYARGLILFVQHLWVGGSVFLDDASLGVAGGGTPLDMSLFELTADVKGLAGGVGETLGEYELRIEDPDGNRLAFTGTANGSFQSVGGSLDTAEERNADNVTSNGAFDTNARTFKVIVSFGGSATWGTGGTLVVDNLTVGTASLVGSKWYAGLLWDGVSLPAPDLEHMSLTADVKGNVVGGEYELKLDAINVTTAGLDESFDSITVDLTDVFFDQASIDGGGNYNGYADWNPEIEGENVYGGVWGEGAEFFGDETNPAHMAVSGLASMGNGGGGAGQIWVDGVIYSALSGWYAGLTWPNQALASTDLSQVVLSADVKGEATFWSGQLGEIELRIEDADGDRMVFHVNANGAWQSIGGPLDTATYAPHPEGLGNGMFDLDASTYTVAVSFGDQLSWQSGGSITVDNLYLTPVVVRDSIGSVTITGVADGNFQSVGGLLSTGVSTLATGQLDEAYEGGAGEGVDFFTGGAGGSPGGWDSGLDGEDAFGGSWGTGVLGFARAESCVSCGVGGTQGAQLITSSVSSATDGGWWAGLMWVDRPANLSDLSVSELRADIKGVPVGVGGEIVLRIEDSDGNYAGFVSTADGNYQSIGGTLDAPDRTGQVDNPVPDAVPNPYRLHLDEHTFSVILTFSGTDTMWTSGGTISVDNLYFAGTGLSADDFEVSVNFKNGLTTWGTDGTLTVDNINFAAAAGGNPDLDNDGDVDLHDYAAFQGCFTGVGVPPVSGCEDADIDGDGDVDLTDLASFVNDLTGP
ncbi:MAG: hypothetical protein H6817_04830 [Phycisphaerales bacterium]|nr:hypothetical protein [Phycisphaerales bacterium]